MKTQGKNSHFKTETFKVTDVRNFVFIVEFLLLCVCLFVASITTIFQ
jgi:hypothetical protein